MTTYIAFLLGINIGPHKRVLMSDLKQMCERMGFKNVRTILASGNVVFDVEKIDISALSHRIELELKKTFGFEVGVITRTAVDIKRMIEADPFKGISITKDTRLYVTFYSDEPIEKIIIPYKGSDEGATFRILDVSGKAVYSVLDLGETRTTDTMKVLGKMFGKKITTRNWNTINKLIK